MSAHHRGNVPRFNLASLIWSTLYSWPEVASSGQQPESVSLSDGVLEGLGLHAESAPCCRLLPALFLAPPSSHGLREGGRGVRGGCLVAESWKSTCADTMVRGCCHMVEGPIFKKHRAFSLLYLSLCACLSPMQSCCFRSYVLNILQKLGLWSMSSSKTHKATGWSWSSL